MPPGRRRKRSVGQTASVALLALLKVTAWETVCRPRYKVFRTIRLMIDGWACCQKWSSGCDESCNNWLPSLPGVKFSMRIVLLLTFQFSFHNSAQSWARFTIPAQWAEFCGTFLPTRLLIQVIIYSPFMFSFRSFSPGTFSLIKLHIHWLILWVLSPSLNIKFYFPERDYRCNLANSQCGDYKNMNQREHWTRKAKKVSALDILVLLEIYNYSSL